MGAGATSFVYIKSYTKLETMSQEGGEGVGVWGDREGKYVMKFRKKKIENTS